jgi:hypothetical protein
VKLRIPFPDLLLDFFIKRALEYDLTMDGMLSVCIMVLIMVGTVSTPSAVDAVVKMTMELEKSGDDEYSIESIELNETANAKGIYPFCNYVNPCSFEGMRMQNLDQIQ